MACSTAPLPTNANPNIHKKLYSVSANRGQLLYIYIWGGGVDDGLGVGGGGAYRVEKNVGRLEVPVQNRGGVDVLKRTEDLV